MIERRYYWIHNILVGVDEKDRGKERNSRRERKCESGKVSAKADTAKEGIRLSKRRKITQ